MQYENHNYKDPKLKIIFHPDKLENPGRAQMLLHWHNNPELLFFTKGSAEVHINDKTIFAQNGDIVVIGGNDLHSIYTKESECTYYCLIPDTSFFPFDGLSVQKISNPEAVDLYKKIICEMQSRKEHYRDAVIGYIKVLSVLLARNGKTPNSDSDSVNTKYEIVKNAVNFIYKNYRENISTEDVCENIKLSKYYLCHLFKEVTGFTVIEFLNRVRCRNARAMLSTGKYTVSQTAFENGFSNPSYFTKVYTSVFGISPTKDLSELIKQQNTDAN